METINNKSVIFANALNDLIENSLDETKVRAIVDEAIKNNPQKMRKIEVKTPLATTKVEGMFHKAFEDVLIATASGLNVSLVGGAGSGKTFCAEQVAEALGLEYYFNGITTEIHDLVGYLDVNNNLIPKPFVQAFVNGGLYLGDEFDSWLVEPQLKTNAPLSNGYIDLPDGTRVSKHKNFRMIIASNTWGKGATREYVGRNPMDASTANRFIQIPFDYDNELELALTPNKEWALYVQSVRKVFEDRRMQMIISPRQSEQGSTLLEAGMSRDKVEQFTLWRDLDEDQVRIVKREVESILESNSLVEV